MSIQRLEVEKIDLVVLSESQFLRGLALAQGAQTVEVKKIKVVVIYPDGATPADIADMVEVAKGASA